MVCHTDGLTFHPVWLGGMSTNTSTRTCGEDRDRRTVLTIKEQRPSRSRVHQLFMQASSQNVVIRDPSQFGSPVLRDRLKLPEQQWNWNFVPKEIVLNSYFVTSTIMRRSHTDEHFWIRWRNHLTISMFLSILIGSDDLSSANSNKRAGQGMTKVWLSLGPC